MKLPFLIGDATFNSELSLEEVGDLLSEKIFGGLKFGGKEFDVHEEIPAIFINSDLLGMRIVLDGYPGFGEGSGYSLYISPGNTAPKGETYHVIMDDYLKALIKAVFENMPSIVVQ